MPGVVLALQLLYAVYAAAVSEYERAFSGILVLLCIPPPPLVFCFFCLLLARISVDLLQHGLSFVLNEMFLTGDVRMEGPNLVGMCG